MLALGKGKKASVVLSLWKKMGSWAPVGGGFCVEKTLQEVIISRGLT